MQESCQDYHVHRVDNDFFFNVCNNAMRKPPECADLFGERDNQIGMLEGLETGRETDFESPDTLRDLCAHIFP
jgi:hypothetical protein